MAENWKYQVALSFAGEQRDYVEQVSNALDKMGIEHFYDNDNRSALWGKNLTQCLDEIYYQDSRFVVVFVSKEYREKNWTKWEMASAQDRALRQKDEYILPVYFDDVRLPGLIGSLGHIDAHTTSPEELATLIYEKVIGKKPNLLHSNSQHAYYHALSKPSVNLHEQELYALQNLYKNLQSSTAFVVFGEKGIGKRTTIQLFLDGKANVIHIVPTREPHYQLEPIVDALLGIGIKCDTWNDLMFPEILKKQLLSYCREKQIIVYFEGLDQYEDELVSFALDLSKEVLARYPNSKPLILFEYDSDSGNSQRLEQRLSTLPPMNLEFVPFKRASSEQLRVYLEMVYGKIEIAPEDFRYILNSSYGNIMYLNIIMNYLRIRGILIKREKIFTCGHITEGALTDVLGEYIRERYERLNPDLKDVLSKSAIIGNTFSSELLTSPFGVIHAQELLNKVERISLLIKHESEAIYAFESPESFQVISSSIGENERKQWHGILADFFARRLERLEKGHLPIHPQEAIIYLHSASRHYKFSCNYVKALTYSYQLACRYLEISDYLNTQKAISEARSMLELVDVVDIPDKNLEFHLALLEARCLADMGRFGNALAIYQRCIKHLPAEIDVPLESIKLDAALCYYLNGETIPALNIAEDVKDELRQSAPESFLYCRALSYLASFHDCTGNLKEKQDYFIQALTICRAKAYQSAYYQLIKKASMVYDEAIAIKMYPAAEQYFETHHKIKCLAELQHNAATDYLYLAAKERILSPLEKSIQLFSEFGSAMIHYPLNTMGIYSAVFSKDYHEAIDRFRLALSYQVEAYSQIVLKANIASCYMALGEFKQAKVQLLSIESLLKLPVNADVYDYQIYQNLMWALYNYKTGEYEKCISFTERCLSLPALESRFQYMAKALAYAAKNKLCVDQPPMIEVAPKPVLDIYRKHEIIFFTLRFYE